jgi:hypothetical protein
MVHMPTLFKSLLWDMQFLLDHFMAPDGTHPNALLHGLIGRLVFDMVTQNYNQTLSQNKSIAANVGKTNIVNPQVTGQHTFQPN